MGDVIKDDLEAKKKIKQTTRENTSAEFMLRCFQLGISYDALEHLPLGAVYDMYIEKANDKETYPVKAGQDEIARFFGKG